MNRSSRPLLAGGAAVAFAAMLLAAYEWHLPRVAPTTKPSRSEAVAVGEQGGAEFEGTRVAAPGGPDYAPSPTVSAEEAEDAALGGGDLTALEPTPLKVERLLAERERLRTEYQALESEILKDAVSAVDRMILLQEGEARPPSTEDVFVVYVSRGGARYYVPEMRSERPAFFALRDRIRQIEQDPDVWHDLAINEALKGH